MAADYVICALCRGRAGFYAEVSGRSYLRCSHCRGVFMSEEFFPSPGLEKRRYLEHENDVSDPGYREFALPLALAVEERFRPGEHSGLDFGAGTAPVVSRLLEERGFETRQYDPFFFPCSSVLGRKYDFIVACEVIEHFRRPGREFSLLRGLLEKGGGLFCKTHPYDGQTSLEKWYYAKDPTHLFFYAEETFRVIRRMFGFSKLERSGRIAVFSG